MHIGYVYNTLKISADKERDDNVNDDDAEGRIVDRQSGVDGPCISKLIVKSNNTDIYLRICQKNIRYKPLTEDHHEAHVLEYIMLLDSNFKYINSESNDDPTTCIRCKLNKGTYYIITDTNYRYVGDRHGYVITSYSNNAVELKEHHDKSLNLKEIIRNASYDLVKQVSEGTMTQGVIDKTNEEPVEYTPKSPDKHCSGRLLVYKGERYGKRVPYCIFAFENVSDDYDIKINIEVKKAKKVRNYEIYCDDEIDPSEDKFSITVPPNDKRVLLINKYYYNSNFSVSYSPTAYPSKIEKKN